MSDEAITIEVNDVGMEGKVVFKIKRSMELSKLIIAYEQQKGINNNSIYFMFNGKRIYETDTADKIQLTNDSQIYCTLCTHLMMAHAATTDATIKINDIASLDINRSVLCVLQRANLPFDELWIGCDMNIVLNKENDNIIYVPESSHDMGWLGYFIGRHEHLKNLYIRDFNALSGESFRNVLIPFLIGLSNNKSIERLNFLGIDLLNGSAFTSMVPFFKNNIKLNTIEIHNCDFGDNGCRLFSLALGSSTNKSLENVELTCSGIANEGMVDIITALSMHPHLKILNLECNHLSTTGCKALATLLQHSATQLQDLNLSHNEIDDEGIDALIPILNQHNHIQSLNLSNRSVTSKGWNNLQLY